MVKMILSEFHPNVSRPNIFPELRNLTEDDVYNVAAYMLVAPRLNGAGVVQFTLNCTPYIPQSL
jgi:hypothetical protein